MNATQNNFFKTNKTKLNMYIPDTTLKPLNLDNFSRGKTSCSPLRNTGLCDVLKKTKFTNTKLPMMNGYNNNNPYKLMDVVNNLYFTLIYIFFYRIN